MLIYQFVFRYQIKSLKQATVSETICKSSAIERRSTWRIWITMILAQMRFVWSSDNFFGDAEQTHVHQILGLDENCDYWQANWMLRQKSLKIWEAPGREQSSHGEPLASFPTFNKRRPQSQPLPRTQIFFIIHTLGAPWGEIEEWAQQRQTNPKK